MAKRILFALMCTLLVLMIVMGAIVFDKVSALLSVAQPPQSTPGTQQTEPPATNPPETDPPQTEPPVTEPPHEHKFVLVESIRASCTAFGYNVYSCECGKNHMPADEFSNPLGHNYEAGETVELTCTQDGYTPYTCSRCQDVEKRNYQEAQGHTLGAGLITKPTCEEDGYTTATCSICEEEIISDIVEATGHDYGQWETTVEPGDATPGKRERVCSNCEDVETELLQPNGTLTITDQTEQTLTDSEETEFIRYVITVGTETTPEAYTFTVNSYSGELTFTYDSSGLYILPADDPEEEPIVLDPFQSAEKTVRPTEPLNPPQNEELE